MVKIKFDKREDDYITKEPQRVLSTYRLSGKSFLYTVINSKKRNRQFGSSASKSFVRRSCSHQELQLKRSFRLKTVMGFTRFAKPCSWNFFNLVNRLLA